MNTWENVKSKKAEMRKAAVAALSEEETELLVRVLELEWENRNLNLKSQGSDIAGKIRTLVQQVVK